MKDLDTWFADARKQIGWNQLRRTHFSNKREKMIDSATSFFKPTQNFLRLDRSSQAFPLGKLDDYYMAFVEMEERAQRLFSDKFKEIALARTLDHVAQDSLSLSERHNQPKPRESKNQQSNLTLKRQHAGHAYPSPERSPARTPETLSPSMTAFSIPSNLSLKRCRPSAETCIDHINPDRPQKRLR
jgi:hypothetical protein